MRGRSCGSTSGKNPSSSSAADASRSSAARTLVPTTPAPRPSTDNEISRATPRDFLDDFCFVPFTGPGISLTASSSPNNFSLASRQASASARNCQSSNSMRSTASFSAASCASAKSMLSPPSKICSPTAMRRKLSAPSPPSTAISEKSVVPPPISTTKINSPTVTSLRHASCDCSIHE